MPFKTPATSPLTEAQSKATSKLSAMKTFLSIPSRADKYIPKNRQISAFDFLLQISNSAIGSNFVDAMLKSFFNNLFNENNNKLEKMALKATAKSLDANGKTISNNMSNEAWLTTNVLPRFKFNKRTLAEQIITMVFGPKSKMMDSAKKANPNMNSNQIAELQNRIIDSAACAGSGSLFSLSNDPGLPPGDLEFNRVKLRKELEEGNVEFIINCNEVKIKLPDDTEALLRTNSVINPADIFTNLENFISSEIQRQDFLENNNTIRKSFNEMMVDKTFNLIGETTGAQMDSVINSINSANNNLNITKKDIISNPCEITNLCGVDDAQFKRKSAFSSALINVIYALLISLLFRELSKRIKIFIKKALVQRAVRKGERLKEKQRQRFSHLDKDGKSLSKAKKYREALRGLDSIFELIKDV